MKKVISFSLYGSDTRYTQNALINSKKAEEIFPDWTIVIYYDNTVPKNVIDFLSKKKHIEMINMENHSIKNKRLWRFSILLDKTVDIYIIRDIDSHLSFREKYAVDEWIESKKKFHVMRDHPSHCIFPMSCGMWGGQHDIHLGKIFNNTYLKYNENQYIYDTNLVNNEFWNYIKQDVLVHDSFQLKNYGVCLSFPTKRIGLEHVGSVILNGKIRNCDANILKNNLHLEVNR
tara:strand:- start:138 stop:830 length:693 start_codon:yes stop_codon:yes gene_type:complete